MNVNLKNSNISIKETGLINNENEILKDVTTYTEEDHLINKSQEIKEFYFTLKERILDLDPNIQIKPTKFYMAFKKTKNITDIQIQKDQIKVHINLKIGKIKDPKKITRDVSKIGIWGNGDYEISLRKEDNNIETISNVMDLIKQSFSVNN